MSILEERRSLEQQLKEADERVRALKQGLNDLMQRCPHERTKDVRQVMPPWIKRCLDCGKELPVK